MNEAVTLDIENGIADLRLNRPDKMNAVDENIMTGLREAVAIQQGEGCDITESPKVNRVWFRARVFI